MITDDIGDIYRDLRRGLYQADSGRPDEAVWEWRFSFETHWGSHVTNAIRVMQRMEHDFM
jgi:hypothetical protein